MRRPMVHCLLGFGLIASTATAQATQPEIAARLKGKPLFLRGGWAESKLRFRNDGSPEKKYASRSFTVTGFDMRSVTLKDDTLRIDGNRVGLTFDSQGGVKRVPLNGVRLEIEGGSGTDFSRALDAIFAPDLESLKPDLPFYWKDLAAKNFVPEPPKKKGEKATDTAPGEPLHVGGNVLAPKVLKTVEANFSPEAHDKRYSGTVLVRMVVKTDGSVDASSLRILRAVGLGLEEQAVAAAYQYKFLPATRDGIPVRVEISLEVTFQIF